MVGASVATPIQRTPEEVEKAHYADQDRGSTEAYQRYLSAMDSSMREKIARTTAHLPSTGTIVDLGSGSGSGSFALASLYPSVNVIGVDINRAMVDYSAQNYSLPNLSFVEGNISDEMFIPSSLSGVFACSVLHHVTSFNGFSLNPLRMTLDGIVTALLPHGKLVIRDFVIPRGPKEVLLDLPTGDGAEQGEPTELSTAALFERFAKDFRASTHLHSGVPYERLADPEPGWKRFRLGLRDATEFLLRKDYRKSWDVELQEEYTYFSQADFERELSARGLRISYAAEITNPWITQHRYEGKIRMSDLEGNPLPFPPTNAVVVGTKVTFKDGVRFAETSRQELHDPSFITLRCFKNKSTGEIFELASRPRPTLDLIPWYEVDGDIMVLAKTEYPRPIITTKGRALDGSSVAGYIAEPINAVVQDFASKPIADTLKARTGLEEASLVKTLPGLSYFPSPGATDQLVGSVLAEISPPEGHPEPPRYSGFSTSGTIKPMEVQQILRSAQVGAMFDSRLEINAYHLLLSLERSPGAWIGSEISLFEQDQEVKVEGASDVLHRPPRQEFVEVDPSERRGFFQLLQSNFEELNQAGTILTSHCLEYASPARLSDNTVGFVPLARSHGQILVGLEERDLPAGTASGEHSDLITCPCFRISREFSTLEGAKDSALEKFEKEFGIKVKAVRELGGRYYPSAGLLPEVVYLYTAEIDLSQSAESRSHITWVPLKELAERYREIHDAHLLTGTLRAAHALGLLGRDDHERRIAA